MSVEFRRFDTWSTGTKLLILLTLALLPLGLALAWTARGAIRQSEQIFLESSHRQGLSGSRAIDSIVARNALALRVAANAAFRSGSSDPCRETASSLALTPAVAQSFALRDADGVLLCAAGNFQPQRVAPIVAPGAIDLWAVPSDRSLYYRVGVIDGMATGRLMVDELAAAVRSSEPGVRQLSLRDSRGAVLNVVNSGLAPDERHYRSSFRAADGRLTVSEVTAIPSPGVSERLSVLLPILMLIVAAVGSWFLVKMLLTRPLARLQRAVNEYEPGGRLVLPERLGSTEEIRSLGASFEQAVDRIEHSEHQMAGALEGQRRLVREVHHRVKNNLQVIASLLSIHGRSASTQESRDAYIAIGRRVDALAVVHRNHYAEVEESTGIPLRPLLIELAAILRASAPEKDGKLVMQLDVDPLHTTQDAAVAVSFFVTEVVEYAMLTAPGEPVDVELHRLSELAAVLTVSSNALIESGEGGAPTRGRDQFDRVIGGLARQLRSPLESKMGRLGVNLPVFPERR